MLHNNALGMFQFHKVQLKAGEQPKKTISTEFQFHKVQLKGD